MEALIRVGGEPQCDEHVRARASAAATAAANRVTNDPSHPFVPPQSVLDALPHVIYAVDSSLRLTYANAAWDRAAANVTGAQALRFRDIAGTSLLDHISEPERSTLRLELDDLLAGCSSAPLVKELVMSGADAEDTVVRQTIAVVRDPASHAAIGIVFIGEDVTREHRLASETARLAATDPLTELPNRRTFTNHVADDIERRRQTGGESTLALIDIDFFKQVNDCHGHTTGDAVLCRLAGEVRRRLRAADVLARWGGEEFAALLPDTSCDEAAGIIDRLRAEIACLRLPGGGRTLALTFSAGIAPLGTDLDRAVRFADERLYEAKRRGRNRVCHGD